MNVVYLLITTPPGAPSSPMVLTSSPPQTRVGDQRETGNMSDSANQSQKSSAHSPNTTQSQGGDPNSSERDGVRPGREGTRKRRETAQQRREEQQRQEEQKRREAAQLAAVRAKKGKRRERRDAERHVEVRNNKQGRGRQERERLKCGSSINILSRINNRPVIFII